MITYLIQKANNACKSFYLRVIIIIMFEVDARPNSQCVSSLSIYCLLYLAPVSNNRSIKSVVCFVLPFVLDLYSVVLCLLIRIRGFII